MPDLDLLPPRTAAQASGMAIAILDRLSDHALVTEAVQTAQRMLGHQIWDCGASLYAGAAGSALAFAHAARVCPDASDHWRAQARRWLQLAAEHTRDHPVPSPGLGNGTAGIAFAVAQCDARQRYAGLLHVLHGKLAEQLGHSTAPANGALAFSDYDVISGPAGVLGHLCPHGADPVVRRAADGIVDQLTGRCAGAEKDRHDRSDPGPPGDPLWTRWRIPRQNYPQREEEHQLYPYGYVDLGLAHGIPGPLAALSRAWTAGHRGSGARVAIRTLADQLVGASQADEGGRGWPRVLPFDEAGEVCPAMAHPGGPAYCYGPAGITSALLDAADALNDRSVRAVAVDGFEALIRRLPHRPALPSPGLCHGYAGLLVICRKFTARTGSALARTALVDLVEALLDRCDPRLPLVVQDYKPPEAAEPGSSLATGTAGGWIDSPGLLEGAAGVALALLSVATPAPPQWSRALLID